jgi:hypothetical protein
MSNAVARSTELGYVLKMDKSITDIPKKRGRPPTGKDPMLTFRSPPDLIAAIDTAIARERDTPNRSEMIRRILTRSLTRRGLMV